MKKTRQHDRDRTDANRELQPERVTDLSPEQLSHAAGGNGTTKGKGNGGA